MVKYKYKSLEDFLISTPLTVDASLDDGWGAYFPVKGREIEATILFADIASFSRRTQDMQPTEILIYVNNFFSWITAEAIKGRPCLVDKYIGDEVMVLFSKEFGSEDPFVEALQAARWMAEMDSLSYCPFMGIASGLVTAGYVGTPIKYDCSVFGTPVTLASRCASIKPEGHYPSSIAFPSELWKDYDIDEIFPPRKYEMPDGKIQAQRQAWKICDERSISLKNIGEIKIREIVCELHHMPSQSAENRAKQYLEYLKKNGLYRGNKVS